MKPKETPPSMPQPVDSMEYFDGFMRDQCVGASQASNTVLSVPRRPGEIIWSAARATLTQQGTDTKNEPICRIASCLPYYKVSYVDILTKNQIQKILQVIRSNGTQKCPKCGSDIHVSSEDNYVFSENSKVIFAVSAKMLYQRDGLSFDIAKDIYDFNWIVVNNQVVRIDSSITSADWFVVATLSVRQYEQRAFDYDFDLNKFGEWSIFELTSNGLALVRSESSGQYCLKCYNFFEQPNIVYSDSDKIVAKIISDDLVVDDLNSLVRLLDPTLELSKISMESEFCSFIHNLNSLNQPPYTDNNILKEITAVVHPDWIQLKKLFFADVTWVNSVNLEYQTWLPNSNETELSKISKLVEINYSARLWEFFGIEKALITLVKSTSKFRLLEKQKIKTGNFDYILKHIPDPNSINVFQYTLSSLLRTQIKDLKLSFTEDKTISKGIEILESLGFGSLCISDTLRCLTTPEFERLKVAQTIYSDRRRKTQRVYLLNKEAVADMGQASFDVMNASIGALLTTFQRAFIVSAKHGKTAPGSNSSCIEVYYEFSI